MGIDIGTSACKAVLFDLDGIAVVQASGEYPVYYPQAGYAEQEPDQWWSVVCDTVGGMLHDNGIDPALIAAVGVDGQSWSMIPIDKNGTVLARTPIWFDTRASEECEELREAIGDNEIFAVSGNPLTPSYTLPKIKWFQKHAPDLFEKTEKILQSNSYIVFRLTGEITQDRSQGYGLQCFDIRRGDWNASMCERMNIPVSILPPVYDCHQIVGTVTAKAAEQIGLKAGTPVVAGGLDAACGTLGAGVLHPGETQEQGGQAGGMSICMDTCHADKRLILGFHVIPEHWLLQGGTVGGGGVMRWFEAQFGEAGRMKAAQNGTNSFFELDKEAEQIPAGSEGVIFLPYMAGERSPIWDVNAKGVYYGLDFSKTRAHLLRASLEGVAYSLRHNLEVAEECGVTVSVLRSMGGAANSRLWTQIKADMTGKPIVVPSSDTATTLGAAILAGVGAGIYKNFDEAVKRTVRITREVTPDLSKKAVYDEGFERYKRLYEQVRPLEYHHG